MREIKHLERVKIGGRNINNIRYADDMVMIADTEEKLQNLMDRLLVECARMGLRINIGKVRQKLWVSPREQRDCRWISG